MSETDYGKIVDEYVEKKLELFPQEQIYRDTVKAILWNALLPLFVRLNCFESTLERLGLEHHTREEACQL
jgi:hypothetical protein